MTYAPHPDGLTPRQRALAIVKDRLREMIIEDADEARKAGSHYTLTHLAIQTDYGRRHGPEDDNYPAQWSPKANLDVVAAWIVAGLTREMWDLFDQEEEGSDT